MTLEHNISPGFEHYGDLSQYSTMTVAC